MKGVVRNLEPNTKEWLEWRLEGVGASDVAAVMGRSEYGVTPLMLWEIKTRRRVQPPSSKIMEIGHDVEDKVRAMYEIDEGLSFPPVLAEMADFPFIRASLDGRNKETGRVIEIKMVGEDVFNNGTLKESFRLQATQQMIVSGASEIEFLLARMPNKAKGIKADNYKKVIFKRDEKLFKEVFEAVCAFWDFVKKDVPPGSTDQDVVEVKDKNAVKLLKAYGAKMKKLQAIENKAKPLTLEIEELEEQIASLIKAKNASCAGFRISWTERKGAVDYAKVPELKGVDLEKYRKAASESFSIKPEKK